MKSLIFFFFLLFTCQMQAQSLIKGKVIDNETHQPLERAAVTLTRDSSSTVYKYALTDPKDVSRSPYPKTLHGRYMSPTWDTRKKAGLRRREKK